MKESTANHQDIAEINSSENSSADEENQSWVLDSMNLCDQVESISSADQSAAVEDDVEAQATQDRHVQFGSPNQPAAEDPAVQDEETEIIRYDAAWYKSLFLRTLKMLGFVLLFPLLPSMVAIVMGGLLSWVEDVPFGQGYLYVISDMLGLANPLTSFSPTSVFGTVMDTYVSVMGILFFGIILNIVGTFNFPNSLNKWLSSLVHRRLVTAVAVFIVVPVTITIVSFIFGSILALVEGWFYGDGVRYVFSNILGLGNPLTNVVPATTIGDALDIYISSLALLFLALLVDYVSLLNPVSYVKRQNTSLRKTMRYARQSVRRLPRTFDDEVLEEE